MSGGLDLLPSHLHSVFSLYEREVIDTERQAQTPNSQPLRYARTIYKGAIVFSEQLIPPIYSLYKGAIVFSEH